MNFTLPSFCTLPDSLVESQLVETDRETSTATYRTTDFDGLSEHDKLLRKLEILQMRGVYHAVQ